MLDTEIWREVAGCPGFLISDLGRIFNYKTHKLIKPYIHKSRCGFYLRAKFGLRKRMVHIVVAETYPDIVPKTHLDQTQVDHLDGNTLNPAARNCAWKTPGLNIKAWHASRKITFNGIDYKVKR